MEKEDAKFYEELARAVRKRLGITDEAAGIFTKQQRRLLMLLAEGRILWKIESERSGKGWTYTFRFYKGASAGASKQLTVVLADREMIYLREHVDFFSEAGMCALSPELLHTLELDVSYDEIQQAKQKGSVNPEVFLR